MKFNDIDLMVVAGSFFLFGRGFYLAGVVVFIAGSIVSTGVSAYKSRG